MRSVENSAKRSIFNIVCQANPLSGLWPIVDSEHAAAVR